MDTLGPSAYFLVERLFLLSEFNIADDERGTKTVSFLWKLSLLFI